MHEVKQLKKNTKNCVCFIQMVLVKFETMSIQSFFLIFKIYLRKLSNLFRKFKTLLKIENHCFLDFNI